MAQTNVQAFSGDVAISSNLAVDTNTLFVDSVGNKVGIGTTTPQGLLHISSGTTGDAHLILESDTDNNNEGDNPKIVFKQDGTLYEGMIGLDGGNNLHLKTAVGLGGSIKFSTINQDETTIDGLESNAVQRMTITNTGNVGIGTASPTSKLEVGDGSTSTSGNAPGSITVTGTGATKSTGGKPGLYHRASVGLGLWSDAMMTMEVNGTSGTPLEAMRIKSDGKVGIGTTSPQTKLHVNGAIYLAAESLTTSYVLGSTTDTANMTQVYIAFSMADSGSDWAYLREIGGSNTYELSFDFHDDGNDARFSIRDIYSTQTPDGISTRFRVNGAAVEIPGSLTVAGSGVTSDDRIKYNEEDVTNALTLISQLNPQKYEKLVSVADKKGIWIPTDEEWESVSVKNAYTYVDEFGFIAQDVRNIPELSFLVHGEEIRMDTTSLTFEEFSNLTSEEQMTYTFSYVHDHKTITQEEYSVLTSEKQEVCTTQYTRQFETQSPLNLNYNGLFVVAVGAIKELKAKNDALETQLASILTRLDALETTETSNTETTTETSNVA